ncbi:MAG: MBL fold metallo-hydrolase [Chloroflexota bacterium]|nr:MBL fold metallo-hydrolase [Chloroflexota bacterium]
MQQLGPDVYVETRYEGANVGCVRTGEGLILIDTPMHPRDAQTWRERVNWITGQEVHYVINTTYHPHHMLGNRFFTTARVIAHQAAWDQIEDWNSSKRLLKSLRKQYPKAIGDQTELQIVPPQLTFTGRMIIHRGEKVLHLIHLGGQSPAAIGVYLPEEEIFFSGDVVVNGQHPPMREANTGQWLRALTEIRRLRIKNLVPGLGPLCTKKDTQPLSDYIRLMRRRVRSCLKAGQERKEALDSIDIRELVGFFPVEEALPAVKEEIRVGLRRVYDEL